MNGSTPKVKHLPPVRAASALQLLARPRAVPEAAERTLTAAALRDSQRRYDLATAAGRVAVWEYDVASGKAQTRPPLAQLLGFVPGQNAEHDTWEAFIHPDDQERVRRLSARALAPDAPRDADGNTPCPEIEYRAVGRDGAIFWLADRGTVVRRPDGQPSHAVGVIIDITTRKLVEIERREGQQRFALASAAGRVAVWEMDVGAGHVRSDPPFPELLGFVPGAYDAAAGCSAYVHPDDQPRVLSLGLTELDPAAPRDAEGNTPLPELEYRAFGPGDEMRWMLDRGAVLRRRDGEPFRVVGTTIDITERKRVEAEMRRLTGTLLKIQDDERRRIAGDLHDGVAQDLTAIAINLMRIERLSPDLPAEVRAILDATRGLGERAQREVRTLSYLLHPPSLDQEGLAAAIREYARGFADRTGIAVDIADVTDQGTMAGDLETALYRVVQECLLNVQRHSGSASAAIALAADSGQIVLTVRDCGRGMPRQRGGVSGVGIASMRERLQRLGGRLDIQSIASGTTVRAVVPSSPTPGGTTP